MMTLAEWRKKQAVSRPDWIKVRISNGKNYQDLRGIMRGLSLHTVCEEAQCPNIGECWENRTATFMILGKVCTRACRFCAVITGRPNGLDTEEPERVAEAVDQMGLRHVVVTSVARDDLPDGGAGIFAETILAIRRRQDAAKVEVLIPDFAGSDDALRKVMEAGPDVLNHNLETVETVAVQGESQGQVRSVSPGAGASEGASARGHRQVGDNARGRRGMGRDRRNDA